MTKSEITSCVAAAVDGPRVLARIDELACIGADASGGITRIAFSDAEVRAADLVGGWLSDLGLLVVRDEFGNLFASSDDNSPDGLPWLAGSHLDTVPNGGKLDGALGVVAAVEAVAAMRAAHYVPDKPIEVVIWRCEEPVRFAHGKVGSLLFSGGITVDELAVIDPSALELSLPPCTNELPRRSAHRGVGGCLELHIEQGRRLERDGYHIGVVTAVASPVRLRLTVTGRADHSGATPMDDRQDALCAAAELVLGIESAAREEAKNQSVATVGRLTTEPGTMNVVPGAAELLVDIRGIDAESMGAIAAAIDNEATRISTARCVSIETEVLSRAEPTHFDARVIRALSDAVRTIGGTPYDMPSGAGHDTQCIAALAPAGMLFVPSINGVSHSPAERTRDEDVIFGTRALAGAWAALASSA